LFPGANYNGNLSIGHVGISPKIADAIVSKTFIITKKMIKKYIPKRIADSHKGTYGKASVVAGSRGLSGAAILTCLAALNSGIGIIELFIPESIDLIISTKVVEIITRPLKETPNGLLDLSSINTVVKGIMASDVVAIGPGCGNSNELLELVKQIIKTSEIPLVIDADGLNALAKNIEILNDDERNSPIVLTPHLGEMSRLINRPIEEIQRNKISIVKNFSREYNVILVLKGARTIVGLPNGEIYINLNGNSGMSTAGSGDILTGLIASLIAQGVEPGKSALLGVFIHGYSGDLVANEKGEYGMLAEDIVKSIGQVFKELN
jgi:NAD(P)H-hydrate epimerase